MIQRLALPAGCAMVLLRLACGPFLLVDAKLNAIQIGRGFHVLNLQPLAIISIVLLHELG